MRLLFVEGSGLHLVPPLTVGMWLLGRLLSSAPSRPALSPVALPGSPEGQERARMAQETAMRSIKRRRRIALGRTTESVSKVANGYPTSDRLHPREIAAGRARNVSTRRCRGNRG